MRWTKSPVLPACSCMQSRSGLPCLMSIHADTFPPSLCRSSHPQTDRQTEGEKGMRAKLVTRNTSCRYNSVLCAGCPLLICAIPTANYIHRPSISIIIASISTSTCCRLMNPSGLHVCLSVCKTSVILYKVQPQRERERERGGRGK